jgi:hypothetical protein
MRNGAVRFNAPGLDLPAVFCKYRRTYEDPRDPDP